MPGKGDLSLRLNSSSFPHSILWSPPNIWLGGGGIVISSKGRSRVWRLEREFQAHLGCTMNWIVDPILVRIKVLKCLLYNPQRLQPAILRESLSFFLYPAQNLALCKELQKEQTVTGNFCVHIWLCMRKHQEHDPLSMTPWRWWSLSAHTWRLCHAQNLGHGNMLIAWKHFPSLTEIATR